MSGDFTICKARAQIVISNANIQRRADILPSYVAINQNEPTAIDRWFLPLALRTRKDRANREEKITKGSPAA
ncbi:hypothetical protein IE4771_PB00227 (plasmid) [Rhizobium etli bv. mimosae str. IE4771]|uniref:Uncharacterized protein n=1 Tax=Rhizobium etli bv. mimosae str. IE4771 TaxID=1432050 RepID=A0A060I7W0_RHIET|nr:hypothetical protein IE4771_PB00227 [Rhizobium sp. IE4771]